MNGLELIKTLVPVLVAFMGVGGIGAYYKYRGDKPKTAAEAQKLSADVVVTFAEGWKQYSEKLELRLDRAEQELDRMQKSINEQDARNRKTLEQKDQEIYELQLKNRTLEQRVDELEQELLKYKQIESKVDTARSDIHAEVDKSMDQVKKDQ